MLLTPFTFTYNTSTFIKHIFRIHLPFVGDFQNNVITLEPKVVTLYGNLPYTLEPLAMGCLMYLNIDSSVHDYSFWQRDA